MIRYQFRPSLVDHCQTYVLVRPFYSATDQDFNAVHNKLSRYQFAKAEKDNKRILRFKFHKGFPREHMDWGKIQTHRRSIGLIGIARLSPDPNQHTKDLEKILHRFANIKLQYESVLFDSRLIILSKSKPDLTAKQNFIFLEDSDPGTGEEFSNFMIDFMSSIFVVLESKRIEKMNEKLEKMDLPTAPIEHEQVISESDTRVMKRKCLGRNRKLLADYCLLSGMFQEALFHYGHSSENLRGVQDYLWMGAALEGLCATSIIMTKIEVPFVDSKMLLKNSSNSNMAQGDLNLDEEKNKFYVPLTDEEIVAKYKEVIGCYRRFQTGHIEMEAHLKFVKILISMKRILEACQVIQILLTLPLVYNDNEKVDLCKVISTIFDQIGLKRKAAFFRRRAAMHSFNQNNATSSVLRFANAALLKTTDGYMLNLETHERPTKGENRGWSSLQLKILLDMFHVSNRLGDRMNCIKLLCYILEVYGDLILDLYGERKRSELVSKLEDCAMEIEEEKATHPVKGITMIMTLPIVRNFKLRPLEHHLQPKKQKLDSEQSGPFIFSSLSFQARKKKKEIEVIWVCGDVAEVGMTVDNPLPAEIKVKKMILVTEGISFEAFPATLALPAESGSFPFMLLGTPQEPGTLIIKGYRVDVFGIENTVMLDKEIKVQVSPSLPLIRLSSTLQIATQHTHSNPDDEHYQTLFTSLPTYRGHSTLTIVTLENAGKCTIKSISMKLKKASEKAILYDAERLKSMVPLEPGCSIDLDIVVMPKEAWKMQLLAEKIQSTLTFIYSGEEDVYSGYGREISLVLDIKVMPSLSISNYDVYEIEKHPSCCCLCFDVKNQTSVDINIQTNVRETKDFKLRENCPVQAETMIAARGQKRVGIHFPRCLLLLPHLRMIERIENVYSKAINEAVSIGWTLSDSQFSGITYLADLKCTMEMVNILKPRHLEMRISTNNNVLHEGEEVHIKTCEIMHLHVQLTNAHEFDLHELMLNIKPNQGDVMESSVPLFAHFGTLTKVTKKLSPGEVLDHVCALFFLYPGDYMVDVTCAVNKGAGKYTTKRERAQAMVNDGPGFDLEDGGNEDLQMFVDGTVTPLKGQTRETFKGRVLHKPIVNKWEREFVVHVG